MATLLALRVTQPIGEFFLTSIDAKTLIGRVRNRPRSSGEENNEDVQRIFSASRVNQISNFTQDPDATFPTPIILAVESAKVRLMSFEPPLSNVVTVGEYVAEEGVKDEVWKPADLSEADKKLMNDQVCALNIPDSGIFGDVLDGQHRILGLEKSMNAGKFKLPVVVMFDLDPEDKAYVFSIINSKQTPVSSSLIYDLFDLAEYRSPRKTCHMVAHALNRDPESPFFNKIKMLGRREEHHSHKVMLSQGTFAARIVDLLSADPDKDAIESKKKQPLSDDPSRPLRKYWLGNEDEVITRILLNYFKAVRDHFKEEWDDDSGAFLIRKSVGYTGLIKLLRTLLPMMQKEKTLTYDAFFKKLELLKQNLGDKKFTSEYFASNDSGAKAIASAFQEPHN